MPREFLHTVDDMLEAIVGIQDAAAGMTFRDYDAQWILRHAIQRGIEIISEASRSLPREALDFRPEIPWARVRALGRDRFEKGQP